MEKRPRARDGVPLGWRGGGEAEQSGESWGSRWVSDRGSLSEKQVTHAHIPDQREPVPCCRLVRNFKVLRTHR